MMAGDEEEQNAAEGKNSCSTYMRIIQLDYENGNK